ncbi:heparin lyase I family protein [Nioella ostreopsis]|uniref:heparin lyase I family protein n=1 Tax=Nioella ostreopsis TaxID=2448479 RepID=UPI0013E02541|nr:heparin lyase I family protein [Nioella ostreopsis]
MRFLSIVILGIVLPGIALAQAGLGRLDHNGINQLRPAMQSAIVPPGASEAWHFILPGGSCEREDCRSDRERTQMIQSRPDNNAGEAYRYTFSFYLPDDFPDVTPANTMLWEVKPFGPGKPSIAVEIVDGHLQFTMSNPGISQTDLMNPERPSIMQHMGSIPRGRWTDVMIDVRWSSGEDGILRVYQNGRLIVNHTGPNMEAGVQRQAVMFGLYRSFISRFTIRTGQPQAPTQEAYFANVVRQRISF